MSFFSDIFKAVKTVMIESRDFHRSYEGVDTYREIDLLNDELFPVKGQDFVFHNLGAANIIVVVDRRTTKTVRSHDVYNWFDKTDFHFIQLTNAGAVQYELIVWGVRTVR